MKSFAKLAVTGAIGMLAFAQPAQAACWDQPQLAAARMRDLQTMLMAATLRCHAAGIDIADHYNAFVTARRGELDQANGRIRAHFVETGGQDAYDRFATALANAYGAAATTQSACDEAAQTADDATLSTIAFHELAEQRSDPPQALGGRCAIGQPAEIAAAPAAPPVIAPGPVLLAAASPSPESAVAEMPAPAEIAVAIDVLARYKAATTRMASAR